VTASFYEGILKKKAVNNAGDACLLRDKAVL